MIAHRERDRKTHTHLLYIISCASGGRAADNKVHVHNTSRHLASLDVVLPLLTIAAARLCWRAGARRAVLRTPHPLGPGGPLSHATPSVGRPHSDFKDIDSVGNDNDNKHDSK